MPGRDPVRLQVPAPVPRTVTASIAGTSGTTESACPLPGLPGSEEFMARLSGRDGGAGTGAAPIVASKTKPGTVNAAVAGYLQSRHVQVVVAALDAATIATCSSASAPRTATSA